MSIEAMKMALEVLETTWGNGHEDTLRQWEETIQALRQAIEMAEKQEPVDAVNMSQGRVDETAKGEHEDWEAVAADQAMTIAMMKIENKRKWVGLTPQEFNEIKDTSTTIGYAITRTEAKLREKNVPQP